MNIVNWTPFREMEGFLDRYYHQPSGITLDGAESALRSKGFDWRPSADISETKKSYIIKATLPEVEKEDVEVSVENGVLSISGERRFEKDEETETQHRIESMYGRFSRSFTLPADADASRISAKSKNGVLKVTIPKIKEAEEKAVKISVD